MCYQIEWHQIWLMKLAVRATFWSRVSKAWQPFKPGGKQWLSKEQSHTVSFPAASQQTAVETGPKDPPDHTESEFWSLNWSCGRTPKWCSQTVDTCVKGCCPVERQTLGCLRRGAWSNVPSVSRNRYQEWPEVIPYGSPTIQQWQHWVSFHIICDNEPRPHTEHKKLHLCISCIVVTAPLQTQPSLQLLTVYKLDGEPDTMQDTIRSQTFSLF